MVGWHNRLNGHEFEQTPGDGDVQRSLVYCSPRGCKELDATDRTTTTKTCQRPYRKGGYNRDGKGKKHLSNRWRRINIGLEVRSREHNLGAVTILSNRSLIIVISVME